MKRESLPESLNIDDFEIVSGESALCIAHNWLATFCPSRTSFKGISRHKSYVWDEMNSELENKKAIEQYEKHEAPTYILMEDSFGQDEKVLYIIHEKPNNTQLQDFHVFPKNLAWTMAFTHEDGWIGPKFSKNKNYEKLNQKNVKAMRAISGNYI
ncbi:hypothetical protein tloyanaT_07720 [Thalassotalea loyana]|uniref:Uncharacterized protein n=1 Tax=Thalassotalea loyana TaxID=280483 RepID=A0ABQ6HCS5_9GAMM|nr:hypothetical protein [Thalassotalea loyana]GLX84520.1 hypothetical protein tloyanaT_07720 [Thalassotalea loyana]